jgi:hypothetical protein
VASSTKPVVTPGELVREVPSAAVNDIASEHRRLQQLGDIFRGEPMSIGPITAVLFEDTCSNLINLVQHMA